MIKRISKLFIFLLFFGQMGYFIHLYQLNKANIEIQNKIESHSFQDKNLLEIKVPLHLPYYQDQSEFQSAKGEISLEWRVYNYVKMKVKLDTLYLLCLPNDAKSDLIASFSSEIKIQNSENQRFNIPIGFRYLNIFGLDFIPAQRSAFQKRNLECFLVYHKPLGKTSTAYKGIPENPPDKKFS